MSERRIPTTRESIGRASDAMLLVTCATDVAVDIALLAASRAIARCVHSAFCESCVRCVVWRCKWRLCSVLRASGPRRDAIRCVCSVGSSGAVARVGLYRVCQSYRGFICAVMCRCVQSWGNHVPFDVDCRCAACTERKTTRIRNIWDGNLHARGRA